MAADGRSAPGGVAAPGPATSASSSSSPTLTATVDPAPDADIDVDLDIEIVEEPVAATTEAAAASTSQASPPSLLPPANPAERGARQRAQAMTTMFDLLARRAYDVDFFQALRRLEVAYCDRPERPRFGAAQRPSDEPIRLGQEPSLGLRAGRARRAGAGRSGGPPRLAVHFFGLLGPNGPLPLHLTEYVARPPAQRRRPDVARASSTSSTTGC